MRLARSRVIRKAFAAAGEPGANSLQVYLGLGDHSVASSNRTSTGHIERAVPIGPQAAIDTQVRGIMAINRTAVH